MHITVIKARPFLYAVLQNSGQSEKQKMDEEKTREGNPYSVHFVDPIKNI